MDAEGWTAAVRPQDDEGPKRLPISVSLALLARDAARRPVWKAAGLPLVTLHDCRHTFASFAIAAGMNAKTLSTIMGHADIATTYDLYGHLLPGSEDEAAARTPSLRQLSRRLSRTPRKWRRRADDRPCPTSGGSA